MMIVLFTKHQVEPEKDGVISAVDGVDCVVIGPLYPRASTRYFWGPGHEKVKEETREAEQEVSGRIKKKGSVAFIDGFAMAHDDQDEFKRIDFYHALGWIDRCFLGKKRRRKERKGSACLLWKMCACSYDLEMMRNGRQKSSKGIILEK
jgi:hypothetical protein